MKKNVKWWILAALIVLPVSCSTPASLTYLRDLEYDVPYLAKQAPELRLQVDDKVSIQVFSIDAELAAPFNVTNGMISESGQALANTSYTVDKVGNISFPVLGNLHVQGKTLNEVKEWITSEIVSRGYIKEPIVMVELENFTITLLGQMGHSILPVEGNSINILQVLAHTSGASEVTNLQDVMVIRTEEGVRMAYSIDLQSKSLFDSPVFYLKQNDIVYVKPRGLRASNTLQVLMTAFAPFATAVTTLTSLYVIATKL